METHYRSFSPDLQVRASGQGGSDGRTVYGIAVPYNAPTRIDDNLVEQFARGAFNHQIDKPGRVKFSREHMLLGGELIGVASMLKDDAAGLYVELRTAKTPTGESTLELIKAGALDELSIMFREAKSRVLPGGVTERVIADLREVAIVMEGAYGELATAGGVRSSSSSAPFTVDLDLLRQAEEFLKLPTARNIDLDKRSIDLGMSY